MTDYTRLSQRLGFDVRKSVAFPSTARTTTNSIPDRNAVSVPQWCYEPIVYSFVRNRGLLSMTSLEGVHYVDRVYVRTLPPGKNGVVVCEPFDEVLIAWQSDLSTQNQQRVLSTQNQQRVLSTQNQQRVLSTQNQQWCTLSRNALFSILHECNASLSTLSSCKGVCILLRV